MTSEDISWVPRRMDELCKKHAYDLDAVQRKFMLVQSGCGIPMLRSTLSKLMDERHYDLVGFFAEYLQKDHRTSYQALGRSFTNRCAKAPKDPPELLRLQDHAKAGHLCFVAKFSVQSPWTQDAPWVKKVINVYAPTLEAATQKAQLEASAMIPGGRVANLHVANLLDDPTLELADVALVRLTLDSAGPSEVVQVPTFAEANDVLNAWATQSSPSQYGPSVDIVVKWENDTSFAFGDFLSRLLRESPEKTVQSAIQKTIAFVFREFTYPNRSAADQAEILKNFLNGNALAHCGHVRHTCLLDDRS